MDSHPPKHWFPDDRHSPREIIEELLSTFCGKIDGDAGELCRIAETTGIVDISTEDICQFVRRAKNIRIAHGCGQGAACLEEAFRQAADNLHLAPGSADMLVVSMQTNRSTPILITQLAAWGTSLETWLGKEAQSLWGITYDDTLPAGTVKTTLLCAWQDSEVPPAG